MMEFRVGLLKIYQFGILIISDLNYLRNNQCRKDTLTLLCPSDGRKEVSHMKGILSEPGERHPYHEK